MISEISSTYPIIFTLLWQSSLFVTAGLIGSFILKRHPARAHQVLLLSMIAAVTVPLLSTFVKYMELGIFVEEPVAATSPPGDFIPVSNTPLSATNLLPFYESEQVTEVLPPIETESENFSLPWRKILLFGWIAVSIILLTRLLITFILGMRLVKKAQPFEHPNITASIKSAASKLGVRDNLAVNSSKSISSPVIWCWKRKPILLLPSDQKNLGEKINWGGILCHELAHLKRRDHIAGLFSELMVCILPWHPLLWLAKARMLNLSEQACDDWVIVDSDSGADYAESLLNLIPIKNMAFAPAVVRSKNTLSGRITRILKNSCSNPRVGIKWILSAFIVTICIALIVAFAQTRPVKSEKENTDLLKQYQAIPAKGFITREEIVQHLVPKINVSIQRRYRNEEKPILDNLELEKWAAEVLPEKFELRDENHKQIILNSYNHTISYDNPEYIELGIKLCLMDIGLRCYKSKLMPPLTEVERKKIKETIEIVNSRAQEIFYRDFSNLIPKETIDDAFNSYTRDILNRMDEPWETALRKPLDKVQIDKLISIFNNDLIYLKARVLEIVEDIEKHPTAIKQRIKKLGQMKIDRQIDLSVKSPFVMLTNLTSIEIPELRSLSPEDFFPQYPEILERHRKLKSKLFKERMEIDALVSENEVAFEAQHDSLIRAKSIPKNNLTQLVRELTGKIIKPSDSAKNMIISIYLPVNFPKNQAIQMIYDALNIHGYVTEETDEYVYIRPKTADSETPLITKDSLLSQFQSKNQMNQSLFKIKYNPLSLMGEYILPLISDNGLLSIDENTQTVLVIDTIENLKRVERLIKKFDVPYQRYSSADI